MSARPPDAASCGGGDGVVKGVTDHQAQPRISLAARRERLDRLRRAAAQADTADVLERRAGRSGSAALACLLRERAALHRRVAERVRAG